MKLNLACIRKVLLYLEDSCRINVIDDSYFEYEPVYIDQICSSLPDFPKEDIFYSLTNLEQAKYIEADRIVVDGAIVEYAILFITYAGHEFLSKIKSDSVWKKTIAVIEKLGCAGLKIIGDVSGTYLTESISSLIR